MAAHLGSIPVGVVDTCVVALVDPLPEDHLLEGLVWEEQAYHLYGGEGRGGEGRGGEGRGGEGREGRGKGGGEGVERRQEGCGESGACMRREMVEGRRGGSVYVGGKKGNWRWKEWREEEMEVH